MSAGTRRYVGRSAAMLLALGSIASSPAAAEQVCIEEAAGVCLKYRTVEPKPAPQPARPAPPAQPTAPRFDASPAAEAERALSLTRVEYRKIQAALRDAGHYNGPLDGVMGGGSRAALAAWQEAGGSAATGYLTFEQVLALEEGRPRPAAPRPAPQPAVAAPQPPAAPTLPLQGRTYTEKIGVDYGTTSYGVITVKVTRRSATEALLEYGYVGGNARGPRFSEECVISIVDDFLCTTTTRDVGMWSFSGRLPDVSVTTSYFSRSLEMW